MIALLYFTTLLHFRLWHRKICVYSAAKTYLKPAKLCTDHMVNRVPAETSATVLLFSSFTCVSRVLREMVFLRGDCRRQVDGKQTLSWMVRVQLYKHTPWETSRIRAL